MNDPIADEIDELLNRMPPAERIELSLAEMKRTDLEQEGWPFLIVVADEELSLHLKTAAAPTVSKRVRCHVDAVKHRADRLTAAAANPETSPEPLADVLAFQLRADALSGCRARRA